MQIAVLALPGASPASLAIARDVFRLIRQQVARLQETRDDVGMATPVLLVSGDGRPIRLADGSSVTADAAISAVSNPAAVHIVDMEIDDEALEDFIAAQASVIAWIAAAHAQGATISGAGKIIHLLATAQLLGGAPMWAPAELGEAFRHRFPRIKGAERGPILDRGNLLIARGLAAESALMVRLVDRVLAPEMAGWLARAIGLSPAGSGTLSDDPIVADAQVWLGQRYADRPRLSQLADALGVSGQTLLRRFKVRLGMTPRDYVRRLRINAACLQLQHSARPVSQIAALVGYDDPKAFREAFRGQTGMTATEYRESRRPHRAYSSPRSSDVRVVVSMPCSRSTSTMAVVADATAGKPT